MRNIFTTIILILGSLWMLTGCIEDGYINSADAQPQFSVDTLKMGTFFTEDVTPTFSFVVYNRHDKILNISSIGMRDGGKGVFRLNVDGMSGSSFSNVEIRPNDSIFVFVEARIPTNGNPQEVDFTDKLDFLTNGRTSTVVLEAVGQDVVRHRGLVIDRDTRWTADLPYRIYDSLVVAKDVTLTLDPGVRLYFHDKARLNVRGTLVSEGTAEKPVHFSGDRTDNVVGQIPFDLMAGQWEGVYFYPSSRANRLSHTNVRNTVWGVVVDSIPSDPSAPALYMLNCRMRNSQGLVLQSFYSDVTAIGCELAEASYGIMYLCGGNLRFNHCTIANYYLFTAIYGPDVQLDHFSESTDKHNGEPLMTADFSNCIVYGLGTDLSVGDLTGTSVFMRRCLLKSMGSDDDNFINCLWGQDPYYKVVRDSYIFDYRVWPGSPVIGAADASLTDPAATSDYYGVERGTTPDIGAYVYKE